MMSAVSKPATRPAVSGIGAAQRLSRLFRPRSVAVVGASEKRARSNHAIHALLNADAEVFLVNPNQNVSHGRPTVPNLAAIGKPVDAVFVMVSAATAIEIVREAAASGAGGAIVNAGGFRESGAEGVARERALLKAAGDMPVLGPNCNGYVDVHRSIRLSGAPPLPIKAGGVGLVTHSGALIGSMGVAGHERGVGFSHLISTGNEASVDIADCLDFLVDDPNTRAICLIIETIRRPREFFAAAERARSSNKPIVALKLGRSERGQAIATSHTGAIAGESWVYDLAFRQYGIGVAHDLTELCDRVVCFDQLPPERWSALNGLAIISPSGGGAGMASDMCAQFGIALPALSEIEPELKRLIPSAGIANPIDLTGFVVGNRALATDVLALYANAPAVDTVLLQWFLADGGLEMGEAFLAPFEDLARKSSKTFVIGSLEDGPLGSWASGLPGKGIAATRGLPATLRALQAMGDFVSARERKRLPAPAPVAVDAPPPADIVESEAGPMLGFAAAMKLLSAAGIKVAPYHMLGTGGTSDLPTSFPERLVVKLADIPHRTDIGAVRVGVQRAQLADEVAALTAIASEHNLPPAIVVQPQLQAQSEAFAGIKADSSLGPVVLCGAGGIFIEQQRKIAGALAPLGSGDADMMLDELEDLGLFKPFRGRQPWDRVQLADIVAKLGALAVGAQAWMQSIDINPLLWTGSEFVAVDALCICKPRS
jgi:acyl-CoA synthetase (NDP forming)